MILDNDTTPDRQLYYLGAQVLESILSSRDRKINFFELHSTLKQELGISMSLFTLALDWLFILGVIKESEGNIIKCL